MKNLPVTRRGALTGAVLGAALLSACNAPQAPGVQSTAVATRIAPGIHIGAIQVDTSPVLAQLGDPTATWAQQAVSAQLAQVLASRMAPGGAGAATLAVVVESINLGGGGPANPDIMTGAATLDGQQATVNAIKTWIPNPTDQALPEQSIQWRIQGLSQAFAYLVRRKMHL
jgi:hypothetical protein